MYNMYEYVFVPNPKNQEANKQNTYSFCKTRG